jgi:hypothetical protein
MGLVYHSMVNEDPRGYDEEKPDLFVHYYLKIFLLLKNNTLRSCFGENLLCSLSLLVTEYMVSVHVISNEQY